ncbi:response regulator [Galbibacter sp. EGI 63066]|uniref:response regulator n=1 Tax=Galbibacter sp. EGI 63066 TaxID=2993559 RepID=UPI0022498584|nr:response regulator [Galbibacter sp. EGI 63066]MCX2681896.1 response regulator [Galbibacter sp. EGI 63066]
MMKKPYRTLIIEDHTLIAMGLEVALNEVTGATGATFDLQRATTCAQALSILDKGPAFDLVFLDIQLPPQPDIGMLSGEDLGMEIRNRFPATAIVVSTAYNEHIRIQSILKSIDPDGFFIKGDMDDRNLGPAIKALLFDPPYYSPTVLKSLRNYISNDFILDKRDRQLLYELDKGLTMDKIAKVLSLSRAAVAKRKRNLKLIFGVEDGNDRDLAIKAREKGFI